MHISSQAVVFIMTEKYSTSFLTFLNLSFADYILEHSEDDTKSLFSIIKVGGIFYTYSIYYDYMVGVF